MIERFARERRTNRVFKLAALPPDRIEAVLLNRGISPDSIPDVKAALTVVDVPVNAEEAVAFSFREPYGAGRFGGGRFPVFYSALEEKTCVAEVSHRHASQFEERRTGSSPHDRYYHLIAVNFAGVALNLAGAEIEHPELVSPTESGYLFCRALAGAAIADHVDALYTRSARAPTGTCVPVFSRTTLSGAQALSRFRFYAEHGESRNERLGA